MELLGSGSTITELCTKFNVDRVTLYRRMKAAGRTTPPRGHTDKSIDFYIKQEYESGSTLEQIMLKWSVSKATIYRAIGRARKDNAHDVHVEQGPADRS